MATGVTTIKRGGPAMSPEQVSREIDFIVNQLNTTNLTENVITTPADKELLTYDATNNYWINRTAAEAGLLSPVVITAAATGDYVRYNGSAWVDVTIAQIITDLALDDIIGGSGVDVTAGAATIIGGNATIDVGALTANHDWGAYQIRALQFYADGATTAGGFITGTCNLYENSANVWKTDDAFVCSKFSVGTDVAATVFDLRTSDNTTIQLIGSHADATSIIIDNDNGGDPRINFKDNATTKWSIGFDNSDADKLKIAESVNLQTNTRMTMLTGGNVHFNSYLGVGVVPALRLDVRGSNAIEYINLQNTNASSVQLVAMAGSGASNYGALYTVGAHNLQFGTDNTQTGMILTHTNNQLQLPTTGSSAGILIGGDFQIYRSAANVGYTPDSFTVAGAFITTTATVTGLTMQSTRVAASPYAVLATDDEIFVDTDGGAITVNLPVGVDGKRYRIINTGSAGNLVTLAPNGAELLLGANSSITMIDKEAIIVTYEIVEGWW